MEQSFSSLTFKGSVTDAILESKNQKKLFVVYISGDDAESRNLERSSWISPKVAESLSKYCILLHIPAGSVDATQFSAIYPQKSVPSITAVGYNGIQLWQNEGFINAEVLATNLEKAWLGLRIQETTASVLSAALASKNLDASTSRPSNSSSSDLGSSTLATVSHEDQHSSSSRTKQGVYHDTVEEDKGPGQLVKEEDIEAVYDESKVNHAVTVENNESRDVEEDKSSLGAPVDQQNCSIEHASYTVHGSSMSPRLNESCQSGGPLQNSLEAENSQQEKSETMDSNEAFKNDRSTKNHTSSDVHLNIRLLNGVNLQEKFSVTSTLRSVKDYVDDHRENIIGSFDLAIPYPRKVFTGSDLDKSLFDLGLSNRQALILVRHSGVSSDYSGTSSSSDQRNSAANDVSSNENGDGYLAYIKRILSYVNPFSYLGGGASSASSRQESQGAIQRSSSDISGQSNSFAAERPHSLKQRTPMAGGTGNTDNTRSRKPSSTRFGANIHTLKHDEDDEQFRGKNSFWNGNSTQYGGGDDAK